MHTQISYTHIHTHTCLCLPVQGRHRCVARGHQADLWWRGAVRAGAMLTVRPREMMLGKAGPRGGWCSSGDQWLVIG